jgi:FkbM family methyltransferase
MSRRPIREFEEFVGFLKSGGFNPGTVIDVGVCYGTPELQQGFPEAYHILFEPVAELEERMKQLTRKYRGEYHMIALGDAPGTFPMNVPEGAVQGASLANAARAKASAVRQVRVDTLDAVLGPRDLAGPVILKTDCQGYDLKVVRGGREFLKRVDLVVMEVNMFHPAGDPALGDFGAIVTWMREQGFSVYDILSYQIRPFDKALGYVDLVFVKTAGPFRAHHRWA